MNGQQNTNTNTSIEKHWERSNNDSCSRKKSFPSYKLAAEFNNRQFKRGSVIRAKGKKIEKMHPYRCKKCNLYHIGHDIRNRQNRLKRLQLQQRQREDS